MAELLADRVRVSDLRGSAAPAAGTAVLEDPSGRRRRRLRLGGRVVALVLTLWLVALVLGGVGLSPVPGVPFAHIIRPASPPPATRAFPQPAEPTAADLEPALPANSRETAVAAQPIHVAGQHGGQNAATKRTLATKRRASGSPRSLAVHTMPPAVDGAPSAAAPGQTTTHPNNGKGSGTTTTTTTATTTTPGRSGAAPGQTGTQPGRSQTTPAHP
jgi:hypothetical protein